MNEVRIGDLVAVRGYHTGTEFLIGAFTVQEMRENVGERQALCSGV